MAKSSIPRRFNRLAARMRRRAGAAIVDNFFVGAARLGRLHPRARPERHNVEVIRDQAYRASGRKAHLLDIYRPTDRPGPYPTVLYVHGGGFRILSKDSHWLMGLAFARQGYLVLNVSYRLAPRDRFPAAIEDCCSALEWAVDRAPAYGADLDRLVFAGESAGANLVTALTLATCYRRPEAFARRAFELGITPRATVAACGILQVSDPGRFRRELNVNLFQHDRVVEVAKAYLGPPPDDDRRDLDLADPLVALERGAAPDRALPPFFIPCGGNDILLDDSRRLAAALERMGVPHDARTYPGEDHAFHAFVFKAQARRCWQHTFSFLDQHLA